MTLGLMEWGKDRLRTVLSQRTRRRIAWSRVAIRKYTAKYRVLPNLLIVGAQRCGTSSLYKHLGRHPEIAASLRKETRYFTSYFDKGEDWYRAHFPLAGIAAGRFRVFFEATPDYLLDPHCAERVVATLGQCHIIAMVRDPVERAYSHYLHNRRLGLESLAFEQALEEESARLMDCQPESGALKGSRPPLAKEYLRFSYATRGRYAEQLKPWLARFPREKVLVVHSEDLFTRPRETFLELCQFLSVSAWAPEEFTNYSYTTGTAPAREGQAMSSQARLRLTEYFEAPNRSLTELLGRSFGWEGQDRS